MKLNDLGWNSFFENQIKNNNKNHSVGRIANVQKGNYLIYWDQGELWGKVSGGYLHRTLQSGNLPVVGDWITFSWQTGDNTAVIHKCLERINKIKRAAAGPHRDNPKSVLNEQVIAANIDLAFIVSGLDRDYNLRRIERYLTLVYDSKATPIIILNKADLCPDPDFKTQEVESIALGVPIYTICAEDQSELTAIQQHLTRGKTAVLLGSSGVGKSTIINKLVGRERQAVHAISDQVGKGMHTTTSRELIILADGGVIIDNPGMRELQLFSDEAGFEQAFNDIEKIALNCRFSDCHHINEPGCAVKQAVDNGDLDPGRYQGYIKLKGEVDLIAERESKGFKLIEKDMYRKIKIYQRQSKKQKRR